ncbi:MAG: 23S rRNA (adenine(2503)-C(2))-methyltransferase RlmN [Prevotellaceae bacterium]|nr:23S rRNA (adenine(2503)-C(2))-methyltransferase RlmN [Prevotellaceae bacterium]
MALTDRPLLGMTIGELRTVAASVGLPAFASKQLAEWLYKHCARSFSEMTNLSKAARERLAEQYSIGCLPPLERHCSEDGTVKYLFPTLSGHRVETVFIPDGERGTLCVSCQVGCRMKCRFCMTGRQTFEGDLTTADILNQVYSLPERERLTNIVFMGQGEPLDNLDNVLRATEILTADYGFGWSPRRITISTAGLRDKLQRCIEECDCHIAISLHSPFPEERADIMPAERAYSLTEMLPLLHAYDWSHQRRLSFEYIVFRGLNDSPRHARELVRLLSSLDCRVNLIRCHEIPTEGYSTPGYPSSTPPGLFEAPEETMLWLRDYLTRHHITTTIRASRGKDILAACGLLSTQRTQ